MIKRICLVFGSLILLLTACMGIYLLTAYLVATSDFRFYPVCFGTPFPSYDDVEEHAWFKFPSSAQNIEYKAISNKGGCTYWVSFEMDSNEFSNSFTDDTLVKELSISTILEEYGFESVSRERGWTQPENSLAGYTERPQRAEFQWISIDTHHQTDWVVYIITRHYPNPL